jgi:hypothetical protein
MIIICDFMGKEKLLLYSITFHFSQSKTSFEEILELILRLTKRVRALQLHLI